MKRIFAYFDEQMISMRRIELSEFQINVAGGEGRRPGNGAVLPEIWPLPRTCG